MSARTRAEHQIIERFHAFRNRYSRRERWNRLLSGLIMVFAVWILARIAGRVLMIPESTIGTGAVLVIGIGYTLIMVYRTAVDPGTAAYIFDRIHDLDGAFITLHSLQLPGNGSVENNQLRHALAKRVKERLPAEELPERSFPSGRAVVCVLLLLIGLGLPKAVFPTSITPNDGTREGRKTMNENRRNDQTASGETNGTPSATNESETRETQFERLMDRYEKLQQGRSVEGDKARMQKRNELKRDMSTYLAQKEKVNPDDPQNAPKRFDTAEQAGEQTLAGPSNTGAGTGTAGAGKSSESNSKREEYPSESGPDRRSNRREKVIAQAIHRLESNAVRSTASKTERPTDNSRKENPESEFLPKDISSDVIKEQEETSYQINLEKIRETVKQPHTVQTWPSRYDRSIARYRSLLSSFTTSEKETNVSEK